MPDYFLDLIYDMGLTIKTIKLSNNYSHALLAAFYGGRRGTKAYMVAVDALSNS
jgi:hypothetical protein